MQMESLLRNKGTLRKATAEAADAVAAVVPIAAVTGIGEDTDNYSGVNDSGLYVVQQITQ